MSGAPPRGALAPVLTPFTETLAPDARRLAAHCRWLADRGAGLAVFGTNSEANSMSVREKRELLDALCEAGVEPGLLLPGAGSCALPDAVELAGHAASLGCAGVLMLPPFYYKDVSDDGLFAFFSETVERVGDGRLRIILYHIPAVSGVPLSLPLIERLAAAHPEAVAGVKDSGGDPARTRELNALGLPGFGVFCGSEAFLLDNMRHGGAGCISATVNINPAAIAGLCERWRDPDAQRMQERLDRVRAVVEDFPMIPALKAAAAAITGERGWLRVRPPLTALDPAREEVLAARLRRAGLEMPG